MKKFLDRLAYPFLKVNWKHWFHNVELNWQITLECATAVHMYGMWRNVIFLSIFSLHSSYLWYWGRLISCCQITFPRHKTILDILWVLNDHAACLFGIFTNASAHIASFYRLATHFSNLSVYVTLMSHRLHHDTTLSIPGCIKTDFHPSNGRDNSSARSISQNRMNIEQMSATHEWPRISNSCVFGMQIFSSIHSGKTSNAMCSGTACGSQRNCNI